MYMHMHENTQELFLSFRYFLLNFFYTWIFVFSYVLSTIQISSYDLHTQPCTVLYKFLYCTGSKNFANPLTNVSTKKCNLCKVEEKRVQKEVSRVDDLACCYCSKSISFLFQENYIYIFLRKSCVFPYLLLQPHYHTLMFIRYRYCML